MKAARMTVSLAEFLDASERIQSADQQSFNGFNGLHGGLAIAALVHQMRARVGADRRLVSVNGRFIRPLTGPIVVDADVVRNGSTLTIACATASSESGTSVEANAIFSAGSARRDPVFAPKMPSGIADRPSAPVVQIPPEFIPISQRMEIRAATPELPYSGSALPVLCGWIRLTDEVPAVDERITILIDSLAPSYTALLTELRAVPTIEMSIQLSADAADSTFEWVLVRASTTSADAHGFVRETIDIWTEEGLHLASCTQLRIVR
jgi:acyl-CoA thioesterase